MNHYLHTETVRVCSLAVYVHIYRHVRVPTREFCSVFFFCSFGFPSAIFLDKTAISMRLTGKEETALYFCAEWHTRDRNRHDSENTITI